MFFPPIYITHQSQSLISTLLSLSPSTYSLCVSQVLSSYERLTYSSFQSSISSWYQQTPYLSIISSLTPPFFTPRAGNSLIGFLSQSLVFIFLTYKKRTKKYDFRLFVKIFERIAHSLIYHERPEQIAHDRS